MPPYRQELRSLDRLVARLPFALDDADAVAEAFERGFQRGEKLARRNLDVWTYCFVRRYYLVRFAREPGLPEAELDEVVENAYKRIERGRVRVRESDRYVRWVAVLCRNTYLNYVTRRREVVAVDRVAEPTVAASDGLRAYDDAVRLAAILAAIARLPRFLRETATLRIVHGLGHETIGERTGRPVASVRALVHKALSRLRKDRRLLRVLGYGEEPEGSLERANLESND